VPLDAGADTAGVAERIMHTAEARGMRGTVVDLSTGASNGTGNALIAKMSGEFDFVSARLPMLSSDTTLGVLTSDRPVLFVASAGRVDRRVLSTGVDTLRRFGVPCAGVVLSRGRPALARG
jgi:Mrp family chromosome partitioning ATPase